jgi:pimeloyl-ACP methyl ester carboxylesterase
MNMPILTMAGELDHKFAAISHKIALGASAGRYEHIAGAGHAAHLQDPGRVTAVLERWLGDIGW